jgi:DNA-binding CsgD family transcriptional regulator
MISDPLAPARTAFARRDWRTAHDALSGSRDGLATADLQLLAQTAWWLGDSPESMAVSEEVYRRLLADGERDQAADRALRLALEWFTRGDVQVGTAWLARARRVISDLPRSALRGYLLYFEGAADMDLSGDADAAEAAAHDVEEIAREHDEPVLGCFALALRGLAAVRRGRTAEGFADLDEAMLPVVAGHVDPLWSGDLYCTVVHLCDELGDLARMRAWTASMARWSRPQGRTFMFASVTRVHELQLVAAEGDWATVEGELGDRSADLVGAHGWLAGEGYYTLAEVRRLRGDAEGARSAYALARELNHDALPGAALLLQAEGRADDALAALRIGLADATRLGRARMLLDAVRLALTLDQRAYAATLTAELEETARWFGTPGLAARAAQARAALLLSGERAGEAVPLLERAAEVYREQRHRYALALVHEALAQAHRAAGDHDRADAATATALAVYTRLGAAPDVARLTSRADRPCGLTDREAEVLAKVAAGATNREVASALGISEKTVGRHLANIFTKVGVGTRTAAAAWARANRLA